MVRVPKLIQFPVELVEKIEKYREENHLSTFTSALFELIRKGLEKNSEE